MTEKSVLRFYESDELLALVILAPYQADGIVFFTEPHDSQQLGYMKRPAGYVVKPHFHRSVARKVRQTQEVLFVRRGSCSLDLYGAGASVLHTVKLNVGDVAFLASGGHGLNMISECEIIEVKQGPYVGELDKVHLLQSP